MFGLGAILAALLPGWRYKPLVLGLAFFTIIWLLLREATLLRSYVAPASGAARTGTAGSSTFRPTPSLCSSASAWRPTSCRVCRWEKEPREFSATSAPGLVATYFFLTAGMLRDYFDQAMPTSLATGFLMVGALSNSVANRLLSGRGIVYIGTISYSLYLFHFVTPGIGFHGQVPDFDTFGKAYYVANYLVGLALATALQASTGSSRFRADGPYGRPPTACLGYGALRRLREEGVPAE
jgi:peptidoglycan/LPS O-acetylase OafA/YrhL